MTLNPHKVLLQQHILTQWRKFQVVGKWQIILRVLEQLIHYEL